MAGKTVTIRMNQQQIELIDDACGRLGETSRPAAVRAALREHGEELLEMAKQGKDAQK